MRKYLLVIMLVGIAGCSSSPIEQKKIVDQNDLIKMDQELFDHVFVSEIFDRSGCEGIVLNDVEASLHPSCDNWSELKWSRKDKLALQNKWSRYSEKSFDVSKNRYEAEHIVISEGEFCGNISIKIYNIDFRAGDIGVAYRDNAGFELPLVTAKLEVLIRNSDEGKIIGVIQDRFNIHRRLSRFKRYEMDPEETKEIITNWGESILKILDAINKSSPGDSPSKTH